MRIGIVCYPSVGGSGVVASELGKSLSRRGHRVHFISYDVPRRLQGATEQFHFHHVDVPLYPLFKFPPYTLALASSIYQIFQETPLDVLHVHYAIPHCTSAFLAKQMLCKHHRVALKVVATLHGTDTELVGQMPSYKPVVEFSIDSCNAVTAVSQYLKKATLAEFDIKKDIQVIHNPIDTDYFCPPPHDPRPARRNKTIVHISNFRPVKRIEDIIKVFDLITSAVPARLVFVGEGPERLKAEMLVDRLGLQDKVEFWGPRLGVGEILQDSDLLISASERESFGMTIAEAMSCGTPVVATRAGGVVEVVEDGVTGYLNPVGCIQSIAEAAVKILTDPNLQRQMGAAGRELVQRKFNVDLITSQYEALYQKLIDDPDADCPQAQKRETLYQI
ncbi:MAG TPA: N-acetyl-alpha-D-glucosaminyl L-malate synthase BshA [bacterium]|nr:N-acetyl-alpha-D-glucosaminyl L-malate synthase BshA [bacterium]